MMPHDSATPDPDTHDRRLAFAASRKAAEIRREIKAGCASLDDVTLLPVLEAVAAGAKLMKVGAS